MATGTLPLSERFFVERQSASGPIMIEGPEAKHIGRVMRLGPGDTVVLFDGHGSECLATIAVTSKNSVTLEASLWQPVSREPPVQVTACVAVPKGDRAKFMVEKLTEIGVHQIIPLVCQRSNVRPKDNTIEKLRRYVIEASKQCGRNQLMQIGPPQSVDELIEKLASQTDDSEPTEKFICAPGCQASLGDQWLADKQQACPNVWLMVGPEGGFSEQESS